MAVPVSAATFYRNHYPWDHLVAFLTRHGDELCQREFAIEGAYYKRYIVARNAAELKQAVWQFPDVKSFHVGPVYSGRVARHAEREQSRPVRRELVFDIDLTDYEFLNLELPDGGVDMERCDKAWPVCATAVFVLQWLLKQAFGFKEFVVVYSGRRGVHLYVCDDDAMNLNNEQRSAITDFLKYDTSEDKLRAHENLVTMANTQGLSEALRYAFETFYIDRMGLFDDPAARVDFVERLGLSETHLPMVANLAEDVLEKPDGRAMWEFVKTKVASLPHQWMRDRLDDMICAYVWPRIDANVSRALNHLLKAPFVAHPKSGRVAVPTDGADYYRFDPATAPQLSDLKNPTAFFRLRDAMGWWRPCHVMTQEEEMQENNNPPKTARPRAPPSPDVDMEDLVGAQRRPPVTGRKKKAFLRKRSPLSQVYTDSSK